MLPFYWSRAHSALQALVRGAGVLYTVPLLLAAVAVGFNRKIAQAISDWNGFSGWWALIIPGGLLLYALAHGHYERTQARDAAMQAFKERLNALETAPGLSATLISQHGGTIADSRIEGNIMTIDAGGPQAQRAPELALDALGERCAEVSQRISAFSKERAAEVAARLESEFGAGWELRRWPNMAQFEEHWDKKRRLEGELLAQYQAEFGTEVLFLGEELQAHSLMKPRELEQERLRGGISEVADKLGAAALRIEARLGQGEPPSPPPPELGPGGEPER